MSAEALYSKRGTDSGRNPDVNTDAQLTPEEERYVRNYSAALETLKSASYKSPVLRGLIEVLSPLKGAERLSFIRNDCIRYSVSIQTLLAMAMLPAVIKAGYFNVRTAVLITVLEEVSEDTPSLMEVESAVVKELVELFSHAHPLLTKSTLVAEEKDDKEQLRNHVKRKIQGVLDENPEPFKTLAALFPQIISRQMIKKLQSAKQCGE